MAEYVCKIEEKGKLFKVECDILDLMDSYELDNGECIAILEHLKYKIFRDMEND